MLTGKPLLGVTRVAVGFLGIVLITWVVPPLVCWLLVLLVLWVLGGQQYLGRQQNQKASCKTHIEMAVKTQDDRNLLTANSDQDN